MQNTLNLERRQTTSTTDSFPEFLGSSVSKEEIETLENKIYVLESQMSTISTKHDLFKTQEGSQMKHQNFEEN